MPDLLRAGHQIPSTVNNRSRTFRLLKLNSFDKAYRKRQLQLFEAENAFIQFFVFPLKEEDN